MTHAPVDMYHREAPDNGRGGSHFLEAAASDA